MNYNSSPKEFRLRNLSLKCNFSSINNKIVFNIAVKGVATNIPIIPKKYSNINKKEQMDEKD